MSNVTNMGDYLEKKGRTNDVSKEPINPAKLRRVGAVLGAVAALGAVTGYMSQPETRVVSTTGSEVQQGQILSVTAENQLAQAIAEAAGKAPEAQLAQLQNGQSLVAVQKEIVGADGESFANPNGIDIGTAQHEPIVQVTETNSRFSHMFRPEEVGQLGITALPVDPGTGLPK